MRRESVPLAYVKRHSFSKQAFGSGRQNSNVSDISDTGSIGSAPSLHHRPHGIAKRKGGWKRVGAFAGTSKIPHSRGHDVEM